MTKFVVTVSGRRHFHYEGSFEILDSGVLKVSTLDDEPRYFSPSAWLWVGEKEGPPVRPDPV
jgi:hypothetical protein